MFGRTICTSNHMFGRAVWDKLPEWIFENFEIARVKRGQFQIFKNHEGNVILCNVILYFKLA